MGRALKVVYIGPKDEELDDYIIRTLISAGFRWYVQGTNLSSPDAEREICFEIPEMFNSPRRSVE